MFRKRLRHQYASIPTPSPVLSLHLPPLLWNVLNLQSEAEVCLSDSLSIVYVPVYAHPSQSACPSLLCPCLCLCLCPCLCQARLLWRWECVVPFFLYILGCTCHSSCLCKWSTFLSLLDCIAGALAFAYCTPFPWGGEAEREARRKSVGKNWVKLCHRFAKEKRENAPNYKSKLTSVILPDRPTIFMFVICLFTCSKLCRLWYGGYTLPSWDSLTNPDQINSNKFCIVMRRRRLVNQVSCDMNAMAPLFSLIRISIKAAFLCVYVCMRVCVCV